MKSVAIPIILGNLSTKDGCPIFESVSFSFSLPSLSFPYSITSSYKLSLCASKDPGVYVNS